MSDLAASAKRVADFLGVVIDAGGFRLRYKITAGSSASEGAVPSKRDISVDFSGPDAPLLTDRNGELLHALEHVAAKMLRFESDEHDRIRFDTGGFKADRENDLIEMAEDAAEQVRRTGRPYSFRPMNSRERRLLHLALQQFEDLRTESAGEGTRRYVVLYPRDTKNTVRAAATAHAFRRR